MTDSKNVAVPVNPTYHEILKNDSARDWEEAKDTQYYEYRRKWAFNPKRFVLERGPIHLDIEPTNACNLKCPMCPRTVLIQDLSKNHFPIGFMDFAVYRQLIDQAKEIGVSSVKLNWLGEPLLHNKIIDMVSYAKAKGMVDVMFNTNAVLLTEDISSGLIDAGLDKLFFSFDSPFKEEYENIRIGANYEQVLQNIQNIHLLKKKKKVKSPLTRVSMVMHEGNQSVLESFINLFKDIVDIVAYVEYREPLGKTDDNNSNNTGSNSKGAFACSQLWQRMIISWDGNVMVCCVDAEREFVIGNIQQNSLGELWLNEKYKYIREKHMRGEFSQVNICKKCSLPFRREDGSI